MSAPGRLTLLVTSPRIPAGILTRDAWTALEQASEVLAADLREPTPAALIAAEVAVRQLQSSPPALAAELVARTANGPLVWVGSPDADPGLTDALAQELTRQQQPPEIEVLVGSFDPPGARLLDAVAVMDTLRSPGGCPWDRQQTHASLRRYLIEEAHETVEAIESADPEHLREELGDLLLQVLFQARLAEEADEARSRFDVDDVAAGLVAKLIRRHPHVFADGEASTAEEVERTWEQIKAQEKPERDAGDLLAGIPGSLPPSLVIEKVRDRARRHGFDAELAADLDDLAQRVQVDTGSQWARLREIAAAAPGRPARMGAGR